MKIKILFLTAILACGVSFGSNDLNNSEIIEEQKTNIEASLESIDLDNRSEQTVLNDAETLKVDCVALGVAVYDAAIDQGYSEEDAFDAGQAMVVVCTVLNYIGDL